MAMTDLRVLSAKAALNKMFSGHYFDICTVDKVIKMFEVVPDPEVMKVLNTLHCVHYNTMDRELYRALPSLVQQALNGTPVFQFEVVEQTSNLPLLSVQTPRKGLIARLLGQRDS